MFLCKWRARKLISLHRDNKVVLYCISWCWLFQNEFCVEGNVVVGKHTIHGMTSTTRRYLKDGRLIIVSSCILTGRVRMANLSLWVTAGCVSMANLSLWVVAFSLLCHDGNLSYSCRHHELRMLLICRNIIIFGTLLDCQTFHNSLISVRSELYSFGILWTSLVCGTLFITISLEPCSFAIHLISRSVP